MKTGRYHNIVDISNCNPEALQDMELIKKFIADAISAADMNVLAGPLVAEGIPENPGLSAIAIIDYSHISIHTFTDHGEALIDIFSCKPYDRDVVNNVCKKYFATPESDIREKTVWWEEANE